MKYFIYILFLLILQSCVTSKDLSTDIIIEKESIKIDTINFVDPDVHEEDTIVREMMVIKQDNIDKEKEESNQIKIKPKVNKELKEKVKVEIIDKTTLDDITNESVGIMAYSTPTQMIVGKSYTIKLRISKEKNKIQLVSGDRNIPINDVTVDSKVIIESVRVEPIMSANLISEEGKFIITPASTETQNIEDKGYTEWAWRIVPLKGGQNFLKLVVKVRIVNENGEFYKDITVFDKNIEVKSNVVFSIKTWISNYWQWLITTIIIPFVVWFYKKKSEEKKKKRKS
jgi:hypothetical protein